MADHTIEVNFKVEGRMGVAERSAKIDERVIELLAIAIAPPGSSQRERIEAPALARAIYRAISALPTVMKQALSEVDKS
jgi:hypothetical protein